MRFRNPDRTSAHPPSLPFLFHPSQQHVDTQTPPAAPFRHADRWEQARKGEGDGDKSAIGRSKYAAGASASTATVEAAARESASVARGAASAQAAAETALFGSPQLLPGGGSLNDGAERGGARGEEGGEALPCRLEGRVEDWKPPATADLRSSYRWADEQKVIKLRRTC